MAEKLAQDPAFSQMTQSLQQGLGGAAGRGAASTSAAPPINPNEYAHAMQGMFQNPEFMNMAQELGQKIMQVSGFHAYDCLVDAPTGSMC